MSFINNIKMRPKLIAGFLLAGVVPIVTIAIMSIKKADDALLKEAFAKLSAVQHIKKDQILNYFDARMKLLDDVRMNLRFTGGLPLFKEAFQLGINSPQYKKLIEKREKGFAIFMENFGFYDVFLIDADGNVVYTVAKESDLGANMNDAAWRNTGLGRAYAQSKKGHTFIDFAGYGPSNEAASFIATGLYNGDGEFIGSAAFQVSVGDINTIMQERSGMGATGETYLVGQDKRMRSDSYLDPKSHSVTASFAGNIKENGVDTYATQQAFSGKEGAAIIDDYHGGTVLSVYSPLKLPGNVTWAIMAEIEFDEVEKPINALQASITWLGIIVGLLIGLGAFFFARTIAEPIKKVGDAAQLIADGDLTVDVDIYQEDEVGQLAEVFRVMVANLQKMVQELSNNASTLSNSAVEFSSISEQMLGSSETMNVKTTTVASAAEEINVNMSTISSASTESSESINIIATSTEQMTTMASEIAQNTSKARKVATDAVTSVSTALDKVSNLGTTANDIGKVVDVILEIAEQTKLLALNATIEAARAGEAGKGFAVVANEVKELAKQTNDAVEDIQQKIMAIQSSTGTTIDQIKGIDGVISEVNEIVGTIATAVEEQSTTTKDIAGNISIAATRIQDMAQNVTEAATVTSSIAEDANMLQQNSSEVKEGSVQVNKGVNELTEMSESLSVLVSSFRVN